MLSDLLAALDLANHPRIVLNPTGPTGVAPDGRRVVVTNPSTGKPLAAVTLDDANSYEAIVRTAQSTFAAWRDVPAPVRGQVVREIGNEYRKLKEPLGKLVSLEVGKILAEGLGEVQETIDIADFAIGLSRTIGGKTIPSERPQHRIIESWHPLGIVGVISAFNFPNAVWAWNAMVGAVCGDVMIWKPSLLAPLTAMATNAIADRVATAMGHPGVFQLVIGTDAEIGERLIADRRVPLISATGSCRMGRHVGEVVAKRLGRSLLELGGNNAAVIDAGADLELAIPAVVFAAVGTAGQRCTTTRRLLVHRSLVDTVVDRLANAYRTITIGDPAVEGTLVGPLINARAVEGFTHAVAQAKVQGGTVVVGGSAKPGPGYFVEPTIVRAPANNDLPIAREETFAPILYVFAFDTLEQAIAMNNSVDQGLSSAIFTPDVRASERFLAASGSDCGLAYVNMGTSGAEIGGAFGGEKDTGGGRESGSDSWKAYMRRQTATINHGSQLQLAQGIRFG